jgi:hypothetical protein
MTQIWPLLGKAPVPALMLQAGRSCHRFSRGLRRCWCWGTGYEAGHDYGRKGKGSHLCSFESAHAFLPGIILSETTSLAKRAKRGH